MNFKNNNLPVGTVGTKILSYFAMLGFLSALVAVYIITVTLWSGIVFIETGRNVATPATIGSLKLFPSALILSTFCILFLAPRIRAYLIGMLEKLDKK